MANAGEDFSQFDLSNEEKDKLVAEVIRYILFKTHQNSGCPIKREELTQLITKNYRQRALPALVINEAKEKLSSIFGYEMRELQRSRPLSTNQGRASQQSVSDAKSYVIVSQLPADVYKKYVEDVNTAHLTGFTFAVISIVYLAGGKIPEENLWHHLRRMGLNESDESHPVLGDIKEALEALVQQRYLQKDKVNGPEGNTLFYELAERALDGAVSERIKEYISQMNKARTLFVEDKDERRGFLFDHVWLILKDAEKWVDVIPKQRQRAKHFEASQTETYDGNSPRMSFSVDMNADDEQLSSGTNTNSSGRPTGRKKEKTRKRLEADKSEKLAKMYARNDEIVELIKRGGMKKDGQIAQRNKEKELHYQLMMLQANNERTKLQIEHDRQEKEFMEKDLNSIIDPVKREYFRAKKKEIIEKKTRDSGMGRSSSAFSHRNFSSFSRYGGAYGGDYLPPY